MKIPDLPKTSLAQHDLWARNTIRDIVAGCILNIRLREAGICDRYLCEMNNAELDRYLSLIEEIRKNMIKKW